MIGILHYLVPLYPKFLLLYLLTAYASPPAFAQNPPLNQTTAQEAAKKLNDSGSDDSVKGAVKNGMRALNDLGDLNIPGAIQNGVKAYGQYKNSEELDKLKEKNEELGSKMSGGDKSATQKATGSKLARLPKNFLYEGEAGQLAEQLEKFSGISRSEMLKTAIDVENRARKVAPSQWGSFVQNTVDELIESVANEEYKESLQKARRLAMRMIDNGTAWGVIAKFQNGNETSAKEEITALSAKPMASPMIAPTVTETKPPLSPATAPPPTLSTSGQKTIPTNAGGIHQLETQNEFLDSLINTAKNKSAEPASLFEMVSQKIRHINAQQGLSSSR